LTAGPKQRFFKLDRLMNISGPKIYLAGMGFETKRGVPHGEFCRRCYSQFELIPLANRSCISPLDLESRFKQQDIIVVYLKEKKKGK
jgi:hypothetical protein